MMGKFGDKMLLTETKNITMKKTGDLLDYKILHENSIRILNYCKLKFQTIRNEEPENNKSSREVRPFP
jgi:hypothetical protein